MSARNEGVRGFVSWTTPAEILSIVQRRWTRGDLLAARVTGESSFPLTVQLRRPHPSAVVERFEELQQWIRALERESRTGRGFGYDICWVEVESRRRGRLTLPSAVVVPSAADALQLLDKTTEADRFDALTRQTLKLLPQLRDWLIKNSLRALKAAPHWDRLLTLVAWFEAHPRPHLYLRQIDLPGIDTTFIQEHRVLLADLLNEVLPEAAIDRSATNVREFEQRYGLLSPPPRIRFRILDQSSAISGLTELTVPASELARLPVATNRIFVTDSEINGLAFPAVADSAVLFGLPYDDGRLAELPWLRERAIFYWGDIDPQGFANLDRVRAVLPQTVSFLMDRQTLLTHERSWDRGPENERSDELARLSPEERALLDDLVGNRFGAQVRLDQERVSYRWLKRELERL